MSDHFRLRKATQLRTAEKTEIRTHLKIIHAVSFLSIMLAAASIGLVFLKFLRTTPRWEQGIVQENEKEPTKDFDKYRGYKKVKGTALGYFNFQQTDEGQWSLVTPEGNAFFAMAVNKIWPYNIEDEVYKEKFNNDDEQWAISATTLLDSVRFNTFGNNAELGSLLRPKVLRFPYTLTGNYIRWENGDRLENDDYPDVWSAEWISDVENKTNKESRQYGNDPYVVLKWTANELHFNLQQWDGSPDPSSVYWKKLIQEEGKTPAKDVWVERYKTRYQDDIAAVNAIYGTNMISFDDMYALGLSLYNRFETIEEGEEEDGQKAYQDVDDWSTEIAKQFHKVIYEAMKAAMPNVIVTSERLVQANHSPLYFEKIKPYIDALAVNFYVGVEQGAPSNETLDRYTAMVDGKPIIISEHSYLQEPCNTSDDGGTYPGVPSQTDRADAHKAYRDSILKHPAVTYLGFHEYSDPGARPETNTCGYTNFGLVSRQAEAWQEMIDQGIATWQDFNLLRWQDELIAAGVLENPQAPTNTNTNPITNTAIANAPTTPLTNTELAFNPSTNTTPAFNPSKNVGQILKPIVGVTKGSKFQTNTNPGFNPITNSELLSNPLTNATPGVNRTTQTDVSLNLPDYTDGVADLLPKGPELAGIFAAPAKEPVAPTRIDTVDRSNWKTQTNETYDYSMNYPSDWTAEEINQAAPTGGKIEFVKFTDPTNTYVLSFGMRAKGATEAFTDRTTPGVGQFAKGFMVRMGKIGMQSSSLLSNGKIKEIYYPDSRNGIEVKDGYEAYADLASSNLDPTAYADLDLKLRRERKIAEAILASLEFTQE